MISDGSRDKTLFKRKNVRNIYLVSSTEAIQIKISQTTALLCIFIHC